MGLQLLWYDDDLSSPNYQGDLTPYISSLSFGTKLHGGFEFLDVTLERDLVPSWIWLRQYYHHRLLLLDHLHQTAFEGRVEDAQLVEDGVAVTAAGYWAGCFDQVWNNASGGSEDISVLIKAALTNACPAISSDQSNIADNTMEVPQYLQDDRRPGDLIAQWCALGDSSADMPYLFAIWEDRLPWYWKKSEASADWVVKRSMLADRGLQLQASASNVYTRVKARYSTLLDVVSSRLETAWATDYTGPLGSTVRDYVMSLSQVTTTAANAARDAFLADHVNLKQNLAVRVEKKIADANGVLWPNWRVRAGDLVDFTDLVPHQVLLDLAEAGLDRVFVKATRWTNGLLEIVPDMGPESAAVILARWR